MVSWSHYIIESENAEKALAEIRENSASEGLGDIIGENRILIEGGKSFGVPSSPEIEEIETLKTDIDRIMYVSGNNTSDFIYADLFEVRENGVEKIDSEGSVYWPKSNEGRYQGHSYLPAYFYDKHEFKMHDKSKHQNIDYKDIYKPANYLDIDHICPACENKEIKIDGWHGKCEKCKYANSKPWFEGYFKFKQHAEPPENNSETYRSRLKKWVSKWKHH